MEARPPPNRGRSSYRGGRGGYGRGGVRGGRNPTNGTSVPEHAPVEEEPVEEGELGEMKKKYSSELGMLKDMFPDWTDVDLVFALQETDGDVAATVDHITQGNVSQFAEVKKTKDRARSKAKEEPAAAGANDKFSARGGRGRGGLDAARGGRGRGVDRGRGSFRGGRGGHATTNGTSKDAPIASIPTTESSAWDTLAPTETANGSWDNTPAETTKEATSNGEAEKDGAEKENLGTFDSTIAAVTETVKSSLIPEGVKKSWASMFSAPKPAPAPPKKASPAQPPPAEVAAPEPVPAEPETAQVEETPQHVEAPPAASEEPTPSIDLESSPLPSPSTTTGELELTPTKVPLTEENVEHLPDESHGPASHTVASEFGSVDTRNLTPLPSQKAPIGRPPMGGYSTSAYRATGMPGRTASYQRRVLDQQEALVMPGHNAVDRAAVQFGSMGLNGEAGLDVDEDREEPETQQVLQHSPPAQVKTSLPPVPRQTEAPQELGSSHSQQQGLPTPKQAPGLPPASQHNHMQMQDAMAPGHAPEQSQLHQGYGQQSRYGQSGLPQQDSGAQQQQKYDAFGYQTSGHYDQHGLQQSQQQQSQQPQQQSHSGFGGQSSAPNDYSSYYTSTEQRNAYNQYYGSPYESRSGNSHGQQDAGLNQQRSASGFGAGPNDSAFSAQSLQQATQQVSKPTPSLPATSQIVRESKDRTAEPNSSDRVIVRMSPDSQQSQNPQQHIPRRVPAIHPDLLDSVMRESATRPLSRGRVVEPFDAITPRSNGAPQTTLLTPPHPKVFLSNVSPTLQAQARYGDHAAPGSGQNTPNPLQAPSQQQQQQQQQPPAYNAAGFPYGHPYYSSPYQQAYANQFGYNPQLGTYSAGYPPQQQPPPQQQQQQQKPQQQGSIYSNVPQGYSQQQQPPQSAYDSSSPAANNDNNFAHNTNNSSLRSASGMSLGDDYGRPSATQHHHQATTGFGGIHDPFARGTSGFGGYGGQQSQDESLKPYASEVAKSGASPRPGSAANSTGGAGGSHSRLPPPLPQSGYAGGYGGFPGQQQGGGSQ